MDLNNVPVGASFKFSASALEILHHDIERFDNLYGSGRNPYRVLPETEMRVTHPVVGLEKLPSLQTLRGSDTYVLRRNGLPSPGTLDVEIVQPAPTTLEALLMLPPREYFTTSCDPEFFIEENGKLVPAFDVLPSKAKAFNPFVTVGGEYTAYEDGFGAEMVPGARHCHEDVLNGLGRIFRATLEHLKGHTVDLRHVSTPSHPLGQSTVVKSGTASRPNITASPLNFVEVPAAMLKKATREQVSLGCTPSLNIYGRAPFIIDNPRELPYRVAGGHIHLGSGKLAPWLHERAEPIIKAMDAFCAVPAVALFAGIDDPRRRQYYGRAGEFRKQPHGLEYRTLSNAWLCDPRIAHLVFNLARAAFRFGFFEWREIVKLDESRIQHIIDNYDIPEAHKFIEEQKPVLKWLMEKDSGYSWTVKAFRMMKHGVINMHPTWNQFEKNWQQTRSFENGHRTMTLAAAKQAKLKQPEPEFALV